MSSVSAPDGRAPRASWWVFVLIGLAGGFASGLFGIGGGILMVPLLVAFAHLGQREAAATSLAAILPVSVVGSISYLVLGEVDVPAGALIAVGSVVGAQLGTRLLGRLPVNLLRWAFAALMVTTAVSLLVAVPSREAELETSLGLGAAALALGLVVGVLSGLFGIGGGLVTVPALILLFGANDLTARGTSLLVMVPTSVSGTMENLRRRRVRLLQALLMGAAAAAATPFGVQVAATLSPRVSNVLFCLALAWAIGQQVRKALAHRGGIPQA